MKFTFLFQDPPALDAIAKLSIFVRNRDKVENDYKSEQDAL